MKNKYRYRWCLFVALTLLAGCQTFCPTQQGIYIRNTPRVQTPTTVKVTGPATLAVGQAATFTVTVTYPEPILDNLPTGQTSLVQGAVVRVEIYEDDIGDVLLDRSVNVTIPRGEKSGDATFILTCEDDTDKGRIIRGDNEFNTYDQEWEVFGYVPTQRNSSSKEGDNYKCSCPAPE